MDINNFDCGVNTIDLFKLNWERSKQKGLTAALAITEEVALYFDLEQHYNSRHDSFEFALYMYLSDTEERVIVLYNDCCALKELYRQVTARG